MSKLNMQKDWIVYGDKPNNLFCIAIASNDGGKTWNLIEFVNLFDINEQQFVKTTRMGYMTMIDAAQKMATSYEYVIADHSFSKHDVDTPYWHKLVPKDKFWGMATIEEPIDKAEFEREMAKLVKHVFFKG
jgi:hypothetical protein